MKALSLTEPWATAVRDLLKHWETRSWPTHFRGEFALHAAKGFPRWCKDFAAEQGVNVDALGAIIAIGEITACRQTETVVKEISEQEKKWGDYAAGRFAFKIENVKPLREPVYCKGALGFWTVPPEVEARVREVSGGGGGCGGAEVSACHALVLRRREAGDAEP